MQSYFGALSGGDNVSLLDAQVVQSDIGRSIDVSEPLPQISIGDTSQRPTGLQSQNTISIQNVQLFEDEDVFMCGRCKQQFFNINIFVQHKKDGCISSSHIPGVNHDHPTHTLPSVQLPEPSQFQNGRRNTDLYSSQGMMIGPQPDNHSDRVSLNDTQNFAHGVENAGLNLTQGSQRDRALSSNTVRDAAQNSGICVIPSNSMQQTNMGVNMSEVNNIAQLQGHGGLLQSNVSLNTRSAENIVIGDDILTNSSSSPSQSVFNADPQFDRFQDNEVDQQQLNGIGVSFLQQMPNPNQLHQPLSSLGNTQQVYIHLQPQQQLDTQTTYSILPKDTAVQNYAVGLNLSTFNVTPLTINTNTTSAVCSTREDSSQLQTHQGQSPFTKQVEVAQPVTTVIPPTVELQVSDIAGSGLPILTTKRKQVSRKVYTCQYCSKGFSKTFDLEQHIRSHTGEKPFQCIVCGRAFAQRSNVRKHMETHKVWPKQAMEIMPKIVVRPKNVEDASKGDSQSNTGGDSQMFAMLAATTTTCPYCDQVLGSYNERKTHMQTHKDKQVYKCVKEGCEQTFRDLDAYVEHVKTHEGTMKYRCHHCHKVFTSLRDLGKHQYEEHLNDKSKAAKFSRRYKCKSCPASFILPDLLQKHMEMETHNYTCVQCSKRFSCEKYLRNHMKMMHTEVSERRYKCGECGKMLRSLHYLRSHLLIHTKETPFKCKRCEAAFNRKDNLVRHMLTHDPVKNLKCPFRETMGCKKEFNRPDKLKAHIISHNGIKVHKCSYCPKRYTRRNLKLAHEKLHTGEFQCKVCNKYHKNQKTLDSHKCRPRKTTPNTSSTCNQNKASKISPSTIRNDLINLPEGPTMYAIRSGPKPKLSQDSVTKSAKTVEEEMGSATPNSDVNVVSHDHDGSTEEPDIEVDVEGGV